MRMIGRKNVYTCRDCGGHIVTIDSAEGTTPANLLCRVRHGCLGIMTSAFYRCDQTLIPTYEWVKPSLKWARRKGPEMLDHVKLGGLDLRPITTVEISVRVTQ